MATVKKLPRNHPQTRSVSEQKKIQTVHNLLLHGHHHYVGIAPEELDSLFEKPSDYTVWIGEDSVQGQDQDTSIWGILVLQDIRSAPTRTKSSITIAALVLEKGRSPLTDISTLIHHVYSALQKEQGNSFQLMVMGAPTWMVKPLLHAGLTIVDRIQVFSVEHVRLGHMLKKWENTTKPSHPQIYFRAYQPADAILLSVLDNNAFGVLWHYNASMLEHLSQTHRIQLALYKVDTPPLWQEQIVGYSAVTIPQKQQSIEQSAKQSVLTRLAVSPNMQKKGVGHLLLHECMQWLYAQRISTVFLNTPSGNHSAQMLYKKLGFQSIGITLPVMLMQQT